MFVFNEKWVETGVELSKKYHPEAKIIVGGGYPTLFATRCLESHDIDDVVIGEGDATFLHLMNKYNNFKDSEFEDRFPFTGYGTRDENGKIIISVRGEKQYIDLADLPAPAWHYLNVEKYFEKSGEGSLTIEATRGCPLRCAYCSTNQSWGYRVRYKPYENVIKEMIELVERYHVKEISFIDDNLTFSKDWTIKFLKRVAEEKFPVKIDNSNFSVKFLDEEIIELLVQAGWGQFGIAIETGCKTMQKQINKNLDFDHIRKMVKVIKSYDSVHLHANWMIGFPNETMDQVEETFNFARELNVTSNQFLVVLPYPGTQLFVEAKKQDLLIFTDDNNLDKYDNKKCDYLKSDEWTYNQLNNKIYDINIEMNFLKDLSKESERGKEEHLNYVEDIVKKLPDHVIANIVVGYMHKERGRKDYEEYYKKSY